MDDADSDPRGPAPSLPFSRIGRLRTVDATPGGPWSVGAETMDRGYTEYDEWKEHLGPLGVGKARIQAGWERTETEPGVYDWNWLDRIVPDVAARGVEPWVCLCYGNSSYEEGGGTRLGATVPTTEAGVAAWEAWVRAMVARYGEYVDEWEVWNEPNNTNMGDYEAWADADQVEGNEAALYADFFVRTAEQVRAVQPDATVIGGSLAGADADYADGFLSALAERDALDLLDEITYHPYAYNPDDVFEGVAALRETVDARAPGVPLRQGENGAPSEYRETRALDGHDWSETSQAKWALRRLIGDRARGIDSSIFGVVDMVYPDEINRKGLLYAREDRTVDHRKEAYAAVQHLVAALDAGLEPIPRYPHEVVVEEDRSLACHGFADAAGRQAVALWFDDAVPGDGTETTPVDLTLYAGALGTPAYADLRSGAVHDLPDDAWTRRGSTYEFDRLPAYDSPVLLADRSLLDVE